jgi:hypothetical protein
MKKPELQTMIVRELKALAGKMKVQVPSEARKADIIKLLSAAFKSKPAAKTVKKNAGAKHSVASVKKKAAPAKIAIMVPASHRNALSSLSTCMVSSYLRARSSPK